MNISKKVKRLVCLQEDSKGSVSSVESKGTELETAEATFKETVETTTGQRQGLAIIARRRDTLQQTAQVEGKEAERAWPQCIR